MLKFSVSRNSGFEIFYVIKASDSYDSYLQDVMQSEPISIIFYKVKQNVL